MLTQEQLVEMVYKFTPRDTSFKSDEYIGSRQYQLRLSTRMNARDATGTHKHFFDFISTIFEGFYVANWRRLDEYDDFEYRILLHKGVDIMDDDVSLIAHLNGVRTDLCLFISILEKLYTYSIIETTFDANNNVWNFAQKTIIDSNIQDLIDKLQTEMNNQGYQYLSEYEALTIVPDVETELKEIGTATVFDCLFNDLITVT